MKNIKNALFILNYLWKARKSYIFFLVILNCVISPLFVISNALIQKNVVDGLVANKPLYLILSILLLNYFLLFIRNLLDQRNQEVIFPKVSSILTKKINSEIIEKAVEIELECYDKEEFYINYTKAMQEAEGRVFQVLTDIISLISSIILIVTMLGYIISIDFVLLIFLALTIIVRVWVLPIQNKLAYNHNNNMQKIYRKKNYLLSVFFNRQIAKEMRIFRSLPKMFFEQFTNTVDLCVEKELKYGKKKFKINIMMIFLDIFLIHLLPYAYIIYFASINKITLGEVLSTYTILMNLGNAFMGVTNSINGIIKSGMFVDNLRYVLDYSPKIIDSDNAIECKYINKIEFRNVFFSYGDAEPVLKNVSFLIQKNEKIALVGHNGSGKSTIVKLLLRLYDVSSGEILINDINIKAFTVSSIRHNFLTLFQDFSIFPISIADNIFLGEMVNKESLYEALDSVKLLNKIENLDKRENTVVGKEYDDEGCFFSGGELQRIALARNYVQKSCSALVFDEPTSALDPMAEKDFYLSMLKLSINKISIIITHRMACICKGFRIIIIEQGKIIEQGSFEELMEDKNSKFYGLRRLQMEYYSEKDKVSL